MVDILISIVNTNERTLIEKCLASLYEDSKDSGLSLQTVIVDNNSSDHIEALKNLYPDLSILQQKRNEGFGKSHNRAMREFQDASYYFILNGDCSVPPGQHVLHTLYDFMEQNPKVGICGPKLLYPDGTLQYSCCRFPSFLQPLYSRTSRGKSPEGKRINDFFHMADFSHNATVPVDWIIGSAMLVRKRAVDDVGMFDERYWMYAEDSDWCRGMWEKGWRVYYVPTATLYHIHGRSSAKVPGVLRALVSNRYARVHLASWLKYFWKWRSTHRFCKPSA